MSIVARGLALKSTTTNPDGTVVVNGYGRSATTGGGPAPTERQQILTPIVRVGRLLSR